MSTDTISKLLKSTHRDDIILAINLMINQWSPHSIKEYFKTNGMLVVGFKEEYYIEINLKLSVGWSYYYRGEIAFYMSYNNLELRQHPAKYHEVWNPTEI